MSDYHLKMTVKSLLLILTHTLSLFFIRELPVLEPGTGIMIGTDPSIQSSEMMLVIKSLFSSFHGEGVKMHDHFQSAGYSTHLTFPRDSGFL